MDHAPTARALFTREQPLLPTIGIKRARRRHSSNDGDFSLFIKHEWRYARSVGYFTNLHGLALVTGKLAGATPKNAPASRGDGGSRLMALRCLSPGTVPVGAYPTDI